MSFEKSLSSHTDKQIPRIIHFIWIGGAIPERYLQTIIKMARVAHESGFVINVWTDSHNYIMKTFYNMMHDNIIGITIPFLNIKNIFELKESMRNDPFYENDLKFKRYWGYVNRERVGFKNLASASDFLRYEILRQKGGYYFDTDINFQFTKYTKLIPDSPALGVMVNAKAGKDPYTNHFVFTEMNNNVIGILPEHPIMEDTINKMMEWYKRADETTRNCIYSIPNGSNLMDIKRKPIGKNARFSLSALIGFEASFANALNTYCSSMAYHNNHMDDILYSSIRGEIDDNNEGLCLLRLIEKPRTYLDFFLCKKPPSLHCALKEIGKLPVTNSKIITLISYRNKWYISCRYNQNDGGYAIIIPEDKERKLKVIFEKIPANTVTNYIELEDWQEISSATGLIQTDCYIAGIQISPDCDLTWIDKKVQVMCMQDKPISKHMHALKSWLRKGIPGIILNEDTLYTVGVKSGNPVLIDEKTLSIKGCDKEMTFRELKDIIKKTTGGRNNFPCEMHETNSNIQILLHQLPQMEQRKNIRSFELDEIEKINSNQLNPRL